MSLTSSDLLENRNIVESTLTKQTVEAITPIKVELETLRSDIKDIYEMIAGLHRNRITDRQF